MLNPNGPYMKAMTVIMLSLMVAGAIGYGISVTKQKNSVTKTFVTEFKNA